MLFFLLGLIDCYWGAPSDHFWDRSLSPGIKDRSGSEKLHLALAQQRLLFHWLFCFLAIKYTFSESIKLRFVPAVHNRVFCLADKQIQQSTNLSVIFLIPIIFFSLFLSMKTLYSVSKCLNVLLATRCFLKGILWLDNILALIIETCFLCTT